MPDITHDDHALTTLLQETKNIAVVGASSDPSRDSNRIFAYLQAAGYNVLPVTPKPGAIHGVEPVPTLAAAREHFGDEPFMADIFRAAQYTPGIAQEAADAGASSFWLQFHTVHPDAVSVAVEAGMDVVVDRCIKIEHARLL